MKKLLLLTFLTVSVLSCQKDEKENCHCTGRFSNSDSYPSVYYIDNVEYDCETGQLISPRTNDIFLGCK